MLLVNIEGIYDQDRYDDMPKDTNEIDGSYEIQQQSISDLTVQT